MTPDIAAEAAVWVARLHGPDRSGPMERECLAWQARSALHRLAFERCTDTWQDVAGLTLSSYAAATRGEALQDENKERRPPRWRRWAMAAAALALAAVGVLQPWRTIDTYDTGVGEQRLVMLQDGTRMTLNTATRVRVELAKAQRSVSVEGGEAFFEVAKDASRPFVVRAAGAEVVATGTAFAVRLTPGDKGSTDGLAVTLVEGQVVVRSGTTGQVNTADIAGGLRPPVVMAPGQRVRLSRAVSGDGQQGGQQVDRPRMDQVLAWKRGEAVFDDVPLLDAIAEMNRYSPMSIKMVEAESVGLRISGVFRTGDNASFARAVAKLHGLAIRADSNRLELLEK